MTIPRLTASAERWCGAHAFALRCLGVYAAVRIVGITVLALMAGARDLGMMSILSKWDGEWMIGIARYGYGGIPLNFADANGIHTDVTAYAFFPGYPLAVRTVTLVPGITPFAAAMLVNVIAGLLAAVAIGHVGRLCAQHVRDTLRPTSTSTAGLVLVGLFAATPMSVVLNMAYTEALFCAAAAWALVGVLERRWLLAGFAALGAGLIRPTAAAVIGVVMIAAFLGRRDGWRAWAAIVLAPLGYVGYLLTVAVRTGRIDGWFTIQTTGWNTKFDGGAATAKFLADSLTEASDFAAVATAFAIVAILLLLVWSAVDRIPWPVFLYGAGVVASILMSDGLMMSRARLLLPAFVLLIPVALRIARRPTGEIVAFLGIAALFSGWFGAHMLVVFQYAI